MITRRQSLLLLPAAALAPQSFAFDLGKAMDAAKSATTAASLSDDEVRAQSRRMVEQMDAQAQVAPAASAHAKRLAALTASCREDKGLALNYKVYMTKDVNAFATADGSIRFYSGLMDMMTDDEIRYVIGRVDAHRVATGDAIRVRLVTADPARRELRFERVN